MEAGEDSAATLSESFAAGHLRARDWSATSESIRYNIPQELAPDGPGYMVLNFEPDDRDKGPGDKDLSKLWNRCQAVYLFNDEGGFARTNDNETSRSKLLVDIAMRGSRTSMRLCEEEGDEVIGQALAECKRTSQIVMEALGLAGKKYEARGYAIIRSQGPVLTQQDEHCDTPPKGWSLTSPRPWLSVLVAINPFHVYLRPYSQSRSTRVTLGCSRADSNTDDIVDVLDASQFPSEPVRVDPGQAIIIRGDLVHCGNAFVGSRWSSRDVNDTSHSLRYFYFLLPQEHMTISDNTHFVRIMYSF